LKISLPVIILLITFSFQLPCQQFRFKRPVRDNIQTNGSYLYGEPNFQVSGLAHTGIDISISYDTVFSASDGTVYFVGYNPVDTINGYEPNGAGNYVIIRSIWNNKNVYLNYYHLSKPLVGTGGSVSAGTPIAISGNTGNSTGPHLHFEIRMNSQSFSLTGSRRNPELWAGISGMGAIYGKVTSAPNSTIVNITPDPKPRPPYTTFSYALTYNFNDNKIGSDDIYQENYAIGDVKPGTYTITALNGAYRRIVTVDAGEVVNADFVTSTEEELVAGKDFILYQNYPNPFNSSTKIKYTIPQIERRETKNVILKVYDVLGNGIAELVNEEKEAGNYEVEFTASLSSGIYFYTLHIGDFIQTKSMMYLK
jgi:hypothetical protein